MGFTLEPALANIFRVIMKKFGFKIFRPSEFKPAFYRSYVDDTFLLFHSKDHIEKFRNYLNRQHNNIRFTSEIENENSTSFKSKYVGTITNFSANLILPQTDF